MYRLHRSIKVVLALVLLIVFLPSTFHAQSMGASTEARLSGRDSSLDDAKIYAEYQGVSLEEALYRFHIQDVAGELDAKLSEIEAKTFAGLYIEHTPKFKVVVLFTPDGGKNITDYLTEELIPLVNVQLAKISLVELQDTQKKSIASLWDMKIPVESEINVYENNIKVFVAEADRTRLDVAIKKSWLLSRII